MVTNQKKFDCGHVIEPRRGCYKGVVVIHGDYHLHGCYAEAGCFRGQIRVHDQDQGSVLEDEHDDVQRRDSHGGRRRELERQRGYDEEEGLVHGRYMGWIDDVVRIHLQAHIYEISIRPDAKAKKILAVSFCYRIFLVSIYGAMRSKNGVLFLEDVRADHVGGHVLVQAHDQVRAVARAYEDTESIFWHF